MQCIELVKTDILEQEGVQNHDMQNQLRALDMKFKGLATHTTIMMSIREQTSERQVNARALKLCCRESRKEINELRNLLKGVNDQLQNHRAKHLEAQKMVEEQRRQIEEMTVTDEAGNPYIDQSSLELQQTRALDLRNEQLAKLETTPEIEMRHLNERRMRQQQMVNLHNVKMLVNDLKCDLEQADKLLLANLKPAEEFNDEQKKEMQKTINEIKTLLYTNENSADLRIKTTERDIEYFEESVLAEEAASQDEINLRETMRSLVNIMYQEQVRELKKQMDENNTRKSQQTTLEKLELQLATSHSKLKTAEKGRNEALSLMERQMKRLNKEYNEALPRMLALQLQLEK